MTIIPTRAMQLLERALADNEDNIQLAARDNDVLVRSGRAVVYSRLVEGRYPKWRDVFPRRDGMTKIDLTVGPFYAAVRQAMIVTSEERRGVDFVFGGGKIVLAGPRRGVGRVARRVADRLRRRRHRHHTWIRGTSAISSRCSIPNRVLRLNCATRTAPRCFRRKTATPTSSCRWRRDA